MKAGEEKLANEMRDVKILIILQLLRMGVTQSQIASALGVSPATMSGMLPKGLGAALRKQSKDNELEDEK